MCYGFDGERPLTRSLAARGTGRRAVLRGAAAAGAALVAGAATAATATAGERVASRGGSRLVPPGRISVQLYTLRDALDGDPGYDAVLRRLAEIGYPRVEQALGYFGRTAAELRSFYDRLGIAATSSHDGISENDQALATKIENAVTLGQSYLVVPFLESGRADDWRRWAQRMNVEARSARSAGIRYGYHNHAHEWTTDLGGGTTPWDILTAELDPGLVHLEIDIYWTVTAAVETGESDVEGFTIDVIRGAPQRVLQYHVKDRHAEGGDMADLGTGMIDFGRVFRAHAVQEYIVENDTPDVTPLKTARVGYDYLRRT